MGEHGGKYLVFVDENKVIVAWIYLFRMKVKRTPMVGFFFVRIFVQFTFLNIARRFVVQRVFRVKTLVFLMRENHHLDTRCSIGLWIKLYPFVKLEDRADSFGDVWLMVETFASTTVSKQTQGGHDRLFSLFEVYEIEFAKNHCILNLCGISDDTIVVDDVGEVCCTRIYTIVEC